MASPQSPTRLWQEKWADILPPYSRLGAISPGSTQPGIGMTNRDVENLLTDLFHFAEAFKGDPSVPKAVADAAKRLRWEPHRGPIMRCGEVANTKKHTVRDKSDQWSAVVWGTWTGPESAIPWANPTRMQRAWVVGFAAPDGATYEVGALDLATAAVNVWTHFPRTNRLAS